MTSGIVLIYAFGCLAAAMVADFVPHCDGYAFAARTVLWPLFLIKAALKTLRAGWTELMR
jgi:hypothetical protein